MFPDWTSVPGSLEKNLLLNKQRLNNVDNIILLLNITLGMDQQKPI